MKDWLHTSIQFLVDHPARVKTSGFVGTRTCFFEVRCHPDDVGKIIGRNGKTITALRTILSARAAREKKQVVLEVAE